MRRRSIMNRKILYIIATAWVLAFIWQSYAHAGELTDAYLGKWCSAGGVYWGTDNDDGKCGEGSTSKLTITTKGYIDGAEDGAEYCNFISIKSRFDPKDDFSLRWLRLSEQNFRVDKWSLCRG